MLCFILFCCIFLYQLRSINTTAALFPNLLVPILLILLVYSVAGRLFFGGAGKKPAGPGSEADRAAKPEKTLPLVLFPGRHGLVFYLDIRDRFFPGPIAYALSIPFMLGYKHKKVNIIFALVITLIMVVAFGRIFYITFPETILSDLLN